MQKMHQLVRYLKISDGNMQEGSFRCDANVSLRPEGEKKLGTRAEIKNINSFRFVENAINYEIERQKELLEEGKEVIQETRLYDADRDETRSMRSKEEANDYRYFPDPDLLPISIDTGLIETITSSLPEKLEEKLERYTNQLSIKEEDAYEITRNIDLLDYFEESLEAYNRNPQLLANLLLTEIMAIINKENIEINDLYISPQSLAQLIERLDDGTISLKIAKDILSQLKDGNSSVDDLIEDQGLQQITNEDQIKSVVLEVINENHEQKKQYLSGKEQVLGFLIGRVMQKTEGKANPKLVNDLMRQELSK
jgi:aspartyl-tRNA(Asn)/glutamyl-tRNA(Gln) amidotransferase subunit B